MHAIHLRSPKHLKIRGTTLKRRFAVPKSYVLTRLTLLSVLANSPACCWNFEQIWHWFYLHEDFGAVEVLGIVLWCKDIALRNKSHTFYQLPVESSQFPWNGITVASDVINKSWTHSHFRMQRMLSWWLLGGCLALREQGTEREQRPMTSQVTWYNCAQDVTLKKKKT